MSSRKHFFLRVHLQLLSIVRGWLAFWRRPMVRFLVFSSVVLLLMGWMIWKAILHFLPEKSESAQLASRVTPQTKLERLLLNPSPTPKQQYDTQQWISCSDIRRVLTDTDRVYIGCRGGVLVTNLQGEVIRQYSQADGLTNDIVTDLLVLNKKIFVGSQDGVSVIDTATDVITPLRVQEGLVNGSNISLVADGNDVWVGSFDGVSKIASDTLAITNYKAELADATEIFSVHRIFVTSKAIYIALIASAHSQGGLARFDKATQTFTKIPSGQFFMGKNPLQVTTINYLNLSAVGDQLVLQDGNMFWLAQDRPQLRLTQLHSISETLAQLVQANQISNVELLGTINSQVAIRFVSNDIEHLAVLTPKTKEVRLVPPQDPAFPLVQAYSHARPTIETPPPLMKAQRPFGFGKLLAGIGDEVWLTAHDGVWTLNAKTKRFQKQMSWPDDVSVPDQVWLVPLAGTSQAVLGRQVCGMGCIKPDFWLVELENNSISRIQIPEETLHLFQQKGGEIEALNYVVVQSPTWNSNLQQLEFQLPEVLLTVNLAQNKWHTASEFTTTSSTSLNHGTCHHWYTVDGASRQLQIAREQCPNELGVLRLGDYAFKVQTGVAPYDDWLSDGTGKKISTVAATEPIYSPFPGWTDPVRVVSQASDGEAIWLAHNRGVARYSPQKDLWQVFASKAGLPGPIVEDMVLLDDRLVVQTRGGLAIIQVATAVSETP